MKRVNLILLLVIFGASATLNAQLKTEADSVAYGVAYQQIESWKQQLPPDLFSFEAFLLGVTDAVKGVASKMAPDQIDRLRQALDSKLQERQQAEMSKMSDVNKAEGKKFLDQNGKRPGVKTTASGLQYEIVVEGSGPSPMATDKVTVHYKGTLLDGTLFDSSYDRGEPATFGLNQVIPGWTEGLQFVKVGGKAKLWIPSDIAYGDNPRPGGPIQPGHTLVFEVELIKIGE